MSFIRNVFKSFMNNTLLTFKQDEKQFNIFSNTLLIKNLINHVTKAIINNHSEKTFTTNTVNL